MQLVTVPLYIKQHTYTHATHTRADLEPIRCVNTYILTINHWWCEQESWSWWFEWLRKESMIAVSRERCFLKADGVVLASTRRG